MQIIHKSMNCQAQATSSKNNVAVHSVFQHKGSIVTAMAMGCKAEPEPAVGHVELLKAMNVSLLKELELSFDFLWFCCLFCLGFFCLFVCLQSPKIN